MRSRNYYHFHFTDKETEDERHKVISKDHTELGEPGFEPK
jgi:hypothetical protein